MQFSNSRIEMDAAKTQLKAQTEQVKQYKAISQASEERLMEVTATTDIYNSEMDQKIKQLTQKVEDYEKECDLLRNQLNQAINDLSDSQAALDSKANELQSFRETSNQRINSLIDNERQALD